MKFSVVTVCYNSAKTIERTLRSVAAQRNIEHEHVIVDGGSTDGTREIILRNETRRMKLIFEPDDGIYDAMNKGLSSATGDIVCILNSDDVYHDPYVLSSVDEVFDREVNTDLVLTDVSIHSDVNNLRKTLVRYISAAFFSEWMLALGMMPPHPGIFMRRKVFYEVGAYSTQFKIAADFEYVIRTYNLYRNRIRVLSECTVCMEEGGVSTSGLPSKNLITEEVLRACRDNGIKTNLLFVFLRFPIKLFFDGFLWKSRF